MLCRISVGHYKFAFPVVLEGLEAFRQLSEQITFRHLSHLLAFGRALAASSALLSPGPKLYADSV